MTSRKPNYAVPALEKGLDLIEALADSPTPLRLGELADRLARTPNELFRMLVCLEQRGYIRRVGDQPAYALSLRLLTLAQRHSPQARILAAAREPMRRLAAETGESCHLSVLEHAELVVIAQEESSQPARLSVPVGGRFPARKTVSGRLLLALESGPGFAPTHDRGAAEQIAAFRRTGILLAQDETLAGVWDAAVLVGSPRSPLRAALALSGIKPPAKWSLRPGVKAKLVHAARVITENLQIPE